jgi:8-oxo-dGTP pyrophosphatase MutT (NUDIX family)
VTAAVDPFSLARLPALLNALPDRPAADLLAARGADLRAYTPAAVLVPLLETPSGLHILLTRRTDRLRAHPGQISFPGGRMESYDRDPAQTALRESYEEIGLAVGRITLMGALDPCRTVTGFLVYPIVGVLAPDMAFSPDPNEVAELISIPVAIALDRKRYERKQRWMSGQLRVSHLIRYEQHEVWGATARILLDFAHKVAAPSA